MSMWRNCFLKEHWFLTCVHTVTTKTRGKHTWHLPSFCICLFYFSFLALHRHYPLLKDYLSKTVDRTVLYFSNQSNSPSRLKAQRVTTVLYCQTLQSPVPHLSLFSLSYSHHAGTVRPYRQITPGWKLRLLLFNNRNICSNDKGFSRVPYRNGTVTEPTWAVSPRILHLQRAWVQVPALTLGSSQSPITPGPGDLIFSSCCYEHLHICINLKII